MPSYRLTWVGGLKHGGNGVAIIFGVNKWLLSGNVDRGWEVCVGDGVE